MPIEGRESDAIKNLLDRWMNIRDEVENMEKNPVSSRALHNKEFVVDEEIEKRQRLEKEMQETERQLKGYGIDPNKGQSVHKEMTQ